MHGKRVLLCGGAGYIGSHLVRYLLDTDWAPVVVDDFSAGHREAVPEGVEVVRASVGDRQSLDELFGRYDFHGVVHLCANAFVGESVENPRKYYRNNIANGLVLLEAMLDHDVRQIVFSSSCAVYGYPLNVPIEEDCPAAPISPYGQTKAMFEQILRDFGDAYGLKWAALRYFNASGALKGGEIGEDHDPETHLVPLVLRQVLQHEQPGLFESDRRVLRVFGDDYNTQDGTCVRDYIHVTDLADAHHLALDYLAEGGESVALNLGNEHGFSVLDIISVCEEVAGREIRYEKAERRPGDPDELIGDARLAKKVLGWTTKHSSIQNIIETAWDWHRQHPRGYQSQQ